ncbi:hypothetical protein [Streptomyces sp. Y1]|uniref:Uncharacterized protein n=1 Tax=Streptomyces sp. Y1 TaxID=3238634 RepID=A0AB39TPN2_9ACTN
MTTVIAPAELLDDESCAPELIEPTDAIEVDSDDEATDPGKPRRRSSSKESTPPS